MNAETFQFGFINWMVLIAVFVFTTILGHAGEQKLDLPVFKRLGVVLDYKDLKYNPCDDLIFPSVIEAGKHFDKPLGRYYMYYAPHNRPGGICLAYADSLEGPWTEYENNPLIARTGK